MNKPSSYYRWTGPASPRPRAARLGGACDPQPLITGVDPTFVRFSHHPHKGSNKTVKSAKRTHGGISCFGSRVPNFVISPLGIKAGGRETHDGGGRVWGLGFGVWVLGVSGVVLVTSSTTPKP